VCAVDPRLTLVGRPVRHPLRIGDFRYNSARWQRLRRDVLRRDGGQCLVQGPRCRGVATTVHHIVPSSQRSDLFFEPTNLISSCTTCNYGGGARVAADNGRRRVARLEEIIVEQDQQIQRLLERIAQLESERRAPRAAIY
jgi:5-methylcytosine-specific restriction endonuclease McrA